jgi:hypothetical protein
VQDFVIFLAQFFVILFVGVCGFVKKMTFTLGNVHDSQEFDKLLDCGRAKDKLKTCGEVYADSAYANKPYFSLFSLFYSLDVITP